MSDIQIFIVLLFFPLSPPQNGQIWKCVKIAKALMLFLSKQWMNLSYNIFLVCLDLTKIGILKAHFFRSDWSWK